MSDLLRGYQIEDIRVEHVCDYHQGLTASHLHLLAPSSFSSNNLVCQIIPHYPYIISSFLTECICVSQGLWQVDLSRARIERTVEGGTIPLPYPDCHSFFLS